MTMKHILLALLTCLMAVGSQAQQQRTFNERLFNAKVREITYCLRLSAEQVSKFRPIYEEYNKDMIAAWGEADCDTASTDAEEVTARVKQRMQRQQRAQSIRIAYTDRFATVLTPGQLERFFRVENDIQRRLRERKSSAHRGLGRGKKDEMKRGFHTR